MMRNDKNFLFRLSFCWRRAVLGSESPFELVSDVVEERVNADEKVSVEESVEQAADDTSAREGQNVD